MLHHYPNAYSSVPLRGHLFFTYTRAEPHRLTDKPPSHPTLRARRPDGPETRGVREDLEALRNGGCPFNFCTLVNGHHDSKL